MSLANPKDVETSLMRTLKESESQYVASLLDRAETLLLSRLPDLLTRAASDQQFKALVVLTEAETVARVFRNPSAYRQESEGNYSYSLNFEVASGLLDILDREWERLGAGPSLISIAPKVDGYAAKRFGGVFYW